MRPGVELQESGQYKPIVTRGNRVIWRPPGAMDTTAAEALAFACRMLDEVEAGAFTFNETEGDE